MACFSLLVWILFYKQRLLKGTLLLTNHSNNLDKRTVRSFSSQHFELFRRHCWRVSSLLLYMHASTFQVSLWRSVTSKKISFIYIHMQMSILRRKKKKHILLKRRGKGEKGERGKFGLSPLNRCWNYVLVCLSRHSGWAEQSSGAGLSKWTKSTSCS